jgi:hypothetical protein
VKSGEIVLLDELLKLIKKYLEHLTEETSAPIVEEPTSGKIIMEKTTEDIVAHVREWAIDRVGNLHEEVYKNQKDILVIFTKRFIKIKKILEILMMHVQFIKNLWNGLNLRQKKLISFL